MRQILVIALLVLSLCGCGKKPNVLEAPANAKDDYAYPAVAQP